MSVNDVVFLGLNTVQLVALPVLLVMFVFAVWYGIARGADDAPVLWRKRGPEARDPAERKAAAQRREAA